MNTFLIELQEHEDRHSLRDRLNWVKTPRVLLVWPEHRKVSLTIADLKFLQHHARQLGTQLGIVTRRHDVRLIAQRLGIPVFSSARRAQHQVWPSSPGPRAPRLRRLLRPVRPVGRSLSPVQRFLVFLAGVLATLALLSLFLPRATLTVTPQTHLQHETLLLTASSQARPASFGGDLSLVPVTLELAAEEKLSARQRIVVPTAKAQGEVRFTNLTSSSQSIPAGTIVYVPGDPPIRFVTLNTAGLPASPGQFVDVPIEALEAGSAGNVPAQAIQAVEGPLAFSLAVSNPQPTQGGAEEERFAVSPQDVRLLREQLLARLRYQAQEEAQRYLVEGDLLFPETLQVIETLEDQALPPLETYPSQITLRLRLRFQVWTLPAKVLHPVLEARLNASLPADAIPDAESLRYRLVSTSVESLGEEMFRLRFVLEVQRRLRARIAAERLFAALRARPVSRVSQELRAFPFAEPPQLEVWPPFWPWMPVLPMQMTIRFAP
ncbi:MAG: baseplate J/gp47 family protein [Anaerolineales bacterium]